MQITRELLGKTQKYRGLAFSGIGNRGTPEGENLRLAFFLFGARIGGRTRRIKFELNLK